MYESAPVERLLAEYGPGAAWHTAGRPVRTERMTNTTADSLRCARYGIDAAGNLTGNSTICYPAGSLSVLRTTDEDLNVSYTFTDGRGRTVLSRQVSNGENHDTYSVYDDKGNLRFVLQPEYQTTPDPAKYAFRYEYDAAGRCVKKYLPGADYVEYTYDSAGRLISSQDGN